MDSKAPIKEEKERLTVSLIFRVNYNLLYERRCYKMIAISDLIVVAAVVIIVKHFKDNSKKKKKK